MRRLAYEYLRADSWQACASIAANACAFAMLGACAGIEQGIGSQPSVTRLMIGHWLAGLSLVIAVVALLYVGIGRYLETLERTSEFGILTVLGAPSTSMFKLLAWETLMLAVPGTACGVALVALLKLVVAAVFFRVLAVEFAWAWWPVCACVVAGTSLLGGILAVRRAIGDGVVEALSYKK